MAIINNEQIVSKMNSYLHQASSLMVNWLGGILPKASENWWEECVLDSLSYNQRDIALLNGYSSLDQFDLAALLRIADKSWYVMRGVAYLPTNERENIRDMRRVRNNWAHVSATLPGKDGILADLDTIYHFFDQRGGGNELLDEISQMIDTIRKPASFEPVASIKSEEAEPSSENTADGEVITEKSLVYLVGEPETRGIVMSVSDMEDTKKYEVFVNGNLKTFYSGQIALFNETSSFNWVDTNTFLSYMAAYQINYPSGNNLYSLNSARIDFVPYQFRPALKLIHADEPRILIADSVGVGKTIEAGLIIKELQARNELNNVLIICPKPLVTERKWELEMKRFDEEFVPLTGDMLRQDISDTDRDGAWPVKHSKCIIPYSILDRKTYEGEAGKRGRVFGLNDLDPMPHFDLVIIDEAHHIRNGSIEKEKAFEYKCVKKFCDNADAVVMLTATPIQTSDDDLFTLLNLLRPDVVTDKDTFRVMSRPNAYISKSISAVRHAGDNWQEEAKNALQDMLGTQWGENVVASNPLYKKAADILGKKEVSREERVQLISDLESLHSFNMMLNRTRRRDIQDFCVRRPYTLAVDFTDYQKMLHDEVLKFEESALLKLHGSSRSIPFMMTTVRRQAASCIFALAPYVRDIIHRRFDQINGYTDLDFSDVIVKESDAGYMEDMAKKLLSMADDLPDKDPKFDRMLDVIREKQKLENNKIIIFSTFRYTLDYLEEKLIQAGLRVGKVDGGVKDSIRQDLRYRFELPKEEKDALDILLFTEVGSEGLDYQFCNMMINYDLPWNPMRVEQRIGRIDRRGQLSETVSIYNMITNGTVDADIYYRCLNRIGIFEKSIGECDEILGEIAEKLESIVMDPKLTEEEKKVKLEQVADNEVRRMQELDKLEDEEKEFFGFDLSEYMTSQDISRAENRWLSQNSIRLMIEGYLSKRLGAGNYILGEGDIKQLRLSVSARETLREDLKKLRVGRSAVRQQWEGYLKGREPNHAITFDSVAAEKNRSAFFITAMHPLSRQAAAYFETGDKVYIRLETASENLKAGRYPFSVYAWTYAGLNPHSKLMIVCDDDTVAVELPELFREAHSSIPAGKINKDAWDSLERKHINLWKEARDNEIIDAESVAQYRIEGLKNTYTNKKLQLEQRLADSANDNLRRMYEGEIENSTERYEYKVNEIKKSVLRTDIHTTLIANGILEIV